MDQPSRIAGKLMSRYQFTADVRRSLQRAQHEAASRAHNRVDAEHVLLGVMKNTGPACDAVLREVGADAETLYQQVEALSPRAEAIADTAPSLPYTSTAKEVLQFAVAEARELGHDHIGTEHLLLGLLRSGSQPSAGVLKAAGLSIEGASRTLTMTTPPKPGPPTDPTARRALLIAVIALAVALTPLALAVGMHR